VIDLRRSDGFGAINPIAPQGDAAAQLRTAEPHIVTAAA